MILGSVKPRIAEKLIYLEDDGKPIFAAKQPPLGMKLPDGFTLAGFYRFIQRTRKITEKIEGKGSVPDLEVTTDGRSFKFNTRRG